MPNNQDVTELEDSTAASKLRIYQSQPQSRIIYPGKMFKVFWGNVFNCGTKSIRGL